MLLDRLQKSAVGGRTTITALLMGRHGGARRVWPLIVPAASLKTSTSLLAADTKAASAKPIGHHAKMYKIERYVAIGSLPLLPLAYFVHGHVMDYVLIAAIVINGHWGGMTVVQDYARAVVVGERFAALAPKLMWVASAILLAALLHFEYNDVGLTRAFEMLFEL